MNRRVLFAIFLPLTFTACDALTGPQGAHQATLSVALYNCPDSARTVDECQRMKSGDSLIVTDTNFFVWVFNWSADGIHYFNLQVGYSRNNENCPNGWQIEEGRCLAEDWFGPFQKGSWSDIAAPFFIDTNPREYRYIWSIRPEVDPKAKTLAADTSFYYFRFENKNAAATALVPKKIFPAY